MTLNTSTTVARLAGKGAEVLAMGTFMRGKHGVIAIQATINTVIQLALSIVNGLGNHISSLTTGGTKSIRLAKAQAEGGFGESLGKVVKNLLRMINPGAKLLSASELEDRKPFETGPGLLPLNLMPLGSCSLLRTQQKIINSLLKGCWFNRHVTVRVVAPLSSVAIMVAGAGIFSFGVLNIGLSALSLGTKPTLNTFAVRCTSALGLILNASTNIVDGLYHPSKLKSQEKTPAAIELVAIEKAPEETPVPTPVAKAPVATDLFAPRKIERRHSFSN